MQAQLKSGGKCVLLRIYEKLPYMVKEGGEAVSLDGIKPFKSCGEKIEFFVPETIPKTEKMCKLYFILSLTF